MASNQPTKQVQVPAHRPRDLFDAMRHEFGRVLDHFDLGSRRWPTISGSRLSDIVFPNFDVHENDTSLTIEAELPGVDEKDVNVTIANGVLTVKGEKKFEQEEKKENYYLNERSFGSFERSIRLPESVADDSIDAKFEKGVLKIKATKKPGSQPAERKIPIKKV